MKTYNLRGYSKKTKYTVFSTFTSKKEYIKDLKEQKLEEYKENIFFRVFERKIPNWKMI